MAEKLTYSMNFLLNWFEDPLRSGPQCGSAAHGENPK